MPGSPTVKITVIETLFHQDLDDEYSHVFITCCTDGVKPVVYQLERLTP